METPFFSIIIPTYNRPERLGECLQALAQLNYPRDHFEVIVVDDGSQVPLDSVVATFQSEIELVLLRQANAGPATARNWGAQGAKGEFLAFTDDDCKPAPNWLRVLAARCGEAPGGMIGGHTVNALPDNLYATASQILIDYIYRYYNANPARAYFLTSNNIAVPAERFRAIGGFDTSFPLAAAEDREFCDRWLRCGYPMIYAPEAKVDHAHHLTLSTFWRQHFGYGRGAFSFHKVRSRSLRLEPSPSVIQQIKVEPLSFYFNLLTYPFVQTSSQSPLLLTVLLFLSQLANTVGFFLEANQAASAKVSNG